MSVTAGAAGAFLVGRIAWVQIAEVLDEVLQQHDGTIATDLDVVIDVDRRARAAAHAVIEHRTTSTTA